MDYFGKIYQLICTDGYYYIGSTKNELRKRLYDHKITSLREPDRKVYNHINNVGWSNVKIVLIENFTCNNRQELIRREFELIQSKRKDPYCLNVVGTYMDHDYYEANKEYIKQRHKLYRKDNAELMKEISKNYYDEHRETILARKAEYHKNNTEKRRQYNKQYYEEKKRIEELKKLKKIEVNFQDTGT